MDCEKLGARLSQVRQAAGLSVRGLSAKSGVSSSTLGYVEQGRQYPSVETLERIARALSVSACWLAYGVGSPHPETHKATRGISK